MNDQEVRRRPDVRVDRLGLPFVHTRSGPVYVSTCCLAPVTAEASGGPVSCLACGEPVDPRLTGVPLLEPGDEPPAAVAERWLRGARARERDRGTTPPGVVPQQRRPGPES